MSTKLYLFTLICAFLGGIVCYHNLFMDEYNNLELLTKANEFKYELIKLQDEALMKVDTIFWNNNIYDGDGGDTMCDYLELRNKIDKIYEQEL